MTFQKLHKKIKHLNIQRMILNFQFPCNLPIKVEQYREKDKKAHIHVHSEEGKRGRETKEEGEEGRGREGGRQREKYEFKSGLCKLVAVLPRANHLTILSFIFLTCHFLHLSM